MRIFESIVTVLSIFMLWHLIWSRKRPTGIWKWSLPALLLVFTGCHLVIEGGRLQMVFVYVIAVMVLLASLIRLLRPAALSKRKSLAAIIKSIFAIPLCLIAAGLPYLFPVFSLAHPTGPYKVGTVTYSWIDPSRRIESGTPRTINAQIWYPADIGASDQKAPYIENYPVFVHALKEQYGGRGMFFQYFDLIQTDAYKEAAFASGAKAVPLVFFSHGNMFGTRFSSSFQTIELASHGYVVVAVEHPETALVAVNPEGSFVPFKDSFSALPHDYAAHNKASTPIIDEQTRDIAFVLEQMKQLGEAGSAGPFAGRIDFSRLGIAGHSFGGATAIDVLYNYPEFKAGINMDGFLYGREHNKAVKQPVMFMSGGVQDGSEVPAEMEQVALKRWKQALGNEGTVLQIEGAGHLNFTDFPLYSPLIAWVSPNVRQNHQIVNEATVRFFDRFLKGDPSSTWEALPRTYPGVSIGKAD